MHCCSRARIWSDATFAFGIQEIIVIPRHFSIAICLLFSCVTDSNLSFFYKSNMLGFFSAGTLSVHHRSELISVSALPRWLIPLNSSNNLLVYSIWNRDFREEFSRIILGRNSDRVKQINLHPIKASIRSIKTSRISSISAVHQWSVSAVLTYLYCVLTYCLWRTYLKLFDNKK